MNVWLLRVFGLICSQNPARSWAPGGDLLPFCERCTGLYTGAAIALLLQVALRMRFSPRVLLLHSCALALMVPLGLHWVTTGPVMRTVSGVLFGFAVVSFLWQLPARLWHAPVRSGRTMTAYSAGLLVATATVPALARSTEAIAGAALTAIAVIGLASLTVLTLGDLSATILWGCALRQDGLRLS